MGQVHTNVCFPTFQCATQDGAEDSRGSRRGADNSSSLADGGMVDKCTAVASQRPGDAASEQDIINPAISAPQAASIASRDEVNCVSLIRTIREGRGLSQQAGKILLASWKPATIRQYESHLAKWQLFCVERNLDPHQASENNLIEFLTSMKVAGLHKSSLATAKAAVLNLWIILDGIKLESHVLSLFMRGVSQLEPVRAKARGIWDPSIVLALFESWLPNWELSLLQLTQKCAMLVALATAQRVQTLRLLNLLNVTITASAVAFMIDERLKQTLGDRETPLIYLPRIKDGKVCVWACILAYIVRTRKIRRHSSLFLISKPPHTPAAGATLSRWIRTVLQCAGINSVLYKAHSTRSAAASKARKFVPLDKVLAAADWKGATVFEKYYCRTVSDRGDFAAAVWSK